MPNPPIAAVICPECQAEPTDYAVACSACGLDFFKNDARTADTLAKSINRKERSVFFYVSPIKLVVMSVVTFNFYTVFWFYKNWCYVGEHTDRKLMPLVRAILAPWFYYDFMKEIKKAGHVQGLEFSLSMLFLAAANFITCAMTRLPSPFLVTGIVAPVLYALTLVPTQKCINQLNANSETTINSRFSVINWIAIAVYCVFMALAIVGSLLPPTK